MDEKLKRKFPSWCFESYSYQFATVLTDDIDSLVGCAIEKYVRGNEINYFYDFGSIYIMDKNVRLPLLGIDLALTKGKCWDNHVTRIHKDSELNTESANINSVLNISGDNYFDKYCMSTAILMWSFYDLPLPKTKLGKMLLLAIDSGFLGHYDNRFIDKHTEYLELLGFGELIDLLNNTNIHDYFNLLTEYKLNAKNGGKILINDEGYLQTQMSLEELSKVLGLDLSLPEQQFTLRYQYINKSRQLHGDETGKLGKHVVSFALTNRNFYKYTVR